MISGMVSTISIGAKAFLTKNQKTIGGMAYKLIWSSASRDDLRDIVVFISY